MLKLKHIFKEIILEGKYDSLTRQIVKLIFNHIKQSKNKEKYTYETTINNKLLYFDFILNIYKNKNVDKYIINAYTDAEFDDDAEIEITLQINPNNEQLNYKELFFELNDTVRHELEHLTQSGFNKLANKPNKTNKKAFDRFVDKPYKEYLLKDEIPAYVAGFYRRAKIEKTYIDIIIHDFLYWYVIHNIITKKQMNIIMKKWLEYAQRKYPTVKIKNKLFYIYNKTKNENKKNKLQLLIEREVNRQLNEYDKNNEFEVYVRKVAKLILKGFTQKVRKYAGVNIEDIETFLYNLNSYYNHEGIDNFYEDDKSIKQAYNYFNELYNDQVNGALSVM